MENDFKKMTEYMFIEPKPEKADLIMVFGTKHKKASERAGRLISSRSKSFNLL